MVDFPGASSFSSGGSIDGIDSAITFINEDMRPMADILTGEAPDGQAVECSPAKPGGKPDCNAKTPQDCLLELISNLGSLQRASLYDSTTAEQMSKLLRSPFDEAASAASALFLPGPDVDPDSPLSAQISQYAKQMTEAFTNPFAALFVGQLSLLEENAGQTLRMFFSEPGKENQDKGGLYQQLKARTSTMLRQLLFEPEKMAIHMGSVLVYGVSHALPALQSERSLLRKLRKVAGNLLNQASALPPSMVPGMPSAAACDLLCRAENELRHVRVELRGSRRFNQGRFSAATGFVCEAKDVIGGGALPDLFLKHLKNLYGLSDLQFNALKKGRFLPDPRYRINTILLIKINAAIQAEDVAVKRFHRNLQNFMISLNGLDGLHVADVFEVIIGIIQGQIHIVRASLEAEAAGIDFGGELAATEGLQNTNTMRNARNGQGGVGPSSARNSTEASSLAPGEAPAPTGGDVFGYAGTQASAYVALSVLCPAMDRVKRMYGAIRSILEGNDAFIRMLKQFVAEYQLVACGPDTGADNINAAVESFYKACEQRLAGTVKDNQAVYQQYRVLIAAIDAHEKFLNCVNDRLNALLSMITGGLVSTELIAALSNLVSMAKRAGEIAAAAQALDFGAIRGNKRDGYDLFDAMFRAAQCLLLQCNNPFLSASLRDLLLNLNKERSLALSASVGLSTLDDTALPGGRIGNNARLQAFLRLIQALQKLTSVDIATLCAIDTSANRTGRLFSNDTPGSGIDSGTNKATLLRERQGTLAASRAAYLDPSLTSGRRDEAERAKRQAAYAQAQKDVAESREALAQVSRDRFV